MTQPTKTRRLAGRLLIGAAALALPLTATISYAGDETPPPATTSTQHKTQKITIIDVPEGAAIDDKSLHVRTLERDGKTIVIKTTQPLTDAEAEARIAKAEASLGESEARIAEDEASRSETAAREGQGSGANAPHATHQVMIVRHGDAAAHAEARKSENREVNTMVFTHSGDGKAKPVAHGEAPLVMHGKHNATVLCTKGKPIVAQTTKSADGKTIKSMVMVCDEHAEKGSTIASLRKARDKVAADPNIPAEVKADVLKQLDGEIEKAAKAG